METVRKYVLIRLLVGMFVLTAVAAKCEDKDLKKVADGLDDTVAALSAAQKVVITANTPATPGGPKLLSDDATIKIGGALIRVNEAVIKGVEATREIAKLDEPSRQQIIKILDPIVKAVGDILASPDIAGIPNEGTRTGIRIAIEAVRTNLTAVQAAIALSK